MPSLNNLHQRFGNDKFVVLAISLDDYWSEISAFEKRIPLVMPVVLDKKGDVSSTYGVFQLPESYLIDVEGKVVRRYVGPRDWDDDRIVAEIKKHILKKNH